MPEAPLPGPVRTGGRIIITQIAQQPETLTDLLYTATRFDWENGLVDILSDTDEDDTDIDSDFEFEEDQLVPE